MGNLKQGYTLGFNRSGVRNATKKRNYNFIYLKHPVADSGRIAISTVGVGGQRCLKQRGEVFDKMAMRRESDL
jgi:hypothetical protein